MGTSLYRSGASRTTVRRVSRRAPPAQGVASAVLLALVVTERGPFELTDITSYQEYVLTFGGYTANNLLSQSPIEGYFAMGGTLLKVARVVHCSTPGNPTTRASAAATATLQSSASSPTAGSVTSTNAAPYVLAHGDTIIVAVDGGSATTSTISATAASRTSTTGTYSLSDGQTLQIAIDGGSTLTKTFNTAEFVSISAATPAEVVASLNAFFLANLTGALATVVSNAVKITSTRLGTGSGVNIVGGTANTALTYTTGNTAGTGNVSNVRGVTVAELKTIIEAAVSGCTVTDVGSLTVIASNTTGGSSSIQVTSSSTADDEIGYDNAVHSGGTGAAVDSVTFDAEEGEYGNAVSVTISAASNGDTSYFDCQFLRSGSVANTYTNVTMVDAADPRYLPSIANDNNALGLTVTDEGSGLNPATGTTALAGGDDGLTGLADTDFSGGITASGKTGLRVFDADNGEGTLLICPQRATAAVSAAINTYCLSTRGGRIFAIHDMPAGYSAQGAFDYVRTTAALEDASDVATIYWPRMKVATPDATLYGTGLVTIPPSGDIAGLYAANDAKKRIGGPFEQPAGDDIKLTRALGLETNEVLDITARDKVCSVGINPISKETSSYFLDGGLVLSTTSDWQSIGQSRGVVYLVHETEAIVRPYLQKNNTEQRRNACAADLDAFMSSVTTAEVLATTNPEFAYSVDMGNGLNPGPVQRTGDAYAEIGVAVADPMIRINLGIFRDTRAQDAASAA